MIKQPWLNLFSRDLNKLKEEISLYEEETLLWKVDKQITNSAGNLCLHICGNLRHFIGHHLGNSGYRRDRPAEFNDKNVSQPELLKMVDITIEEVNNALNNLKEEDFTTIQPTDFEGWKIECNLATFIVHIYGHLNYHLGQVNYHRRILG